MRTPQPRETGRRDSDRRPAGERQPPDGAQRPGGTARGRQPGGEPPGSGRRWSGPHRPCGVAWHDGAPIRRNLGSVRQRTVGKPAAGRWRHCAVVPERIGARAAQGRRSAALRRSGDTIGARRRQLAVAGGWTAARYDGTAGERQIDGQSADSDGLTGSRRIREPGGRRTAPLAGKRPRPHGAAGPGLRAAAAGRRPARNRRGARLEDGEADARGRRTPDAVEDSGNRSRTREPCPVCRSGQPPGLAGVTGVAGSSRHRQPSSVFDCSFV